jgi:iron complex outermembrane receptor protein
MPDIMPLRERITLDYHTPAYSLSVDTILSQRQKHINSDVKEIPTPGFVVVNIRGQYNYKELHLEAGIDNLFNKEYYTYTDYYSNPFNTGVKLPQPGRTYYLNVAYRF